MNALRTIDGKSQVKVPSRKKGSIAESTPNKNNIRAVTATSSSHLALQARTTNRTAGCATTGGRRRAPNAAVAISSSKQKTLSKFSTARDEKSQLHRGGVKDQNASLNNVITLSDLVDKKNAAESASSAPDTCGNSPADRIQKHSVVDRRVPGKGRLEVDGHQRSPQKADLSGRRLGGSTQSTDRKVPGLYERRKIDRTRSVPSDRLNTFGVGKAIHTTSESHTKCQKRSVKTKSTADRGRRKTMDDDRDLSSYPAGSRYSSEVGRDRTNLRSTQSSAAESQPAAQQPTQDDSQTACYKKIAPDASRREKLVSGANKELEEFQKYKASKKLTIVTGQAQSTGGAKSMEDARREMEKMQLNKKYEQIRKREKWQQEKREREERELNEKKARAREQTKKNERLREERAARDHRGNHARINEDFLRRLEDKSASPVSAGGPDVRYSQELQSLQEMFPDKDPAKLKKMLELTNGDVSEVAELLM